MEEDKTFDQATPAPSRWPAWGSCLKDSSTIFIWGGTISCLVFMYSFSNIQLTFVEQLWEGFKAVLYVMSGTIAVALWRCRKG